MTTSVDLFNAVVANGILQGHARCDEKQSSE